MLGMRVGLLGGREGRLRLCGVINRMFLSLFFAEAAQLMDLLWNLDPQVSFCHCYMQFYGGVNFRLLDIAIVMMNMGGPSTVRRSIS